MTRIRLALLTFLLLLVGAAPAQATLLARSDDDGLLVRDISGLDDDVDVFPLQRVGFSQYQVFNRNLFDFFKFVHEGACVDDRGTARCDELGPDMRFELKAGDDRLDLRPLEGKQRRSTIFAGPGNDRVLGHDGSAAHSLSRLTQFEGANEMFGFKGNDRLSGGAAGDILHGGDGDDRLAGKGSLDKLDGGGGGDRLVGGDAPDELYGRGGRDSLEGGAGRDSLSASSGNDAVDSRETENERRDAFFPSDSEDRVNCGSGFDTLEVDLLDVITEPGSCEEIDESPVGETPNVIIKSRPLRVSPSGRVAVRLRCPRGVGSLGCKGRLRMRLVPGRGRSNRTRRVGYRITAGRRKTVTLRLSRRAVARLRSRQRRGRRTRGIVRSLEKGRLGPKTTIRNPRLRLR